MKHFTSQRKGGKELFRPPGRVTFPVQGKSHKKCLCQPSGQRGFRSAERPSLPAAAKKAKRRLIPPSRLADSRALFGAPIGALPRNRLAASATGGASAVSLFGSSLPPGGNAVKSCCADDQNAVVLPQTNRRASRAAAAYAILVEDGAQTCQRSL